MLLLRDPGGILDLSTKKKNVQDGVIANKIAARAADLAEGSRWGARNEGARRIFPETGAFS